MAVGNTEETSANPLPLEYAPTTVRRNLSKAALIIGLAANSCLISGVFLYEALIPNGSRPQFTSLPLLWGIEKILAWGSIVVAGIGFILSMVAIACNRGPAEILAILSCALYVALLLAALTFL